MTRPLDRLTPSELVAAYRKSAKKRFGQHFLTDPRILNAIVDSVHVEEGEDVLEIGPGCGTLTSQLIARGAKVRAIEIDRDAATFLKEQFVQHGELELIEGDALRVDMKEILETSGGKKWKCTANLPYNVGTPIFFELTKHRAHFESMALMFQKEVAERMVATPEERKDYGVLSLMTHLYHDARIHMTLPPGAFSPPPKVDSALIVLHPIEASRIPDPTLRKLFTRVVKAAFQQRRKTLSNALKSICQDKELLLSCMEEAGIEAKSRAEVVDFDGFVKLSSALFASSLSGDA